MSTPADTFTDRTGATDQEFQARVAVFDAAEEPEEVVVERVARAMFERPLAESASASWHEVSEGIRLSFRADARAAVAAMPAPTGDPCPTCSWPSRETVGMVCQTCGTDYAPAPVAAEPTGELREQLRGDLTGYLLQFSGRDVDPTDADCLWIANEVNEVLALPAIAALLAKLPAPVAHNHTRFRNDAGPWSPCPVSCPAAGLLR